MIEYKGKIRDGKLGTEKESIIHRCPCCDLMRLDDSVVYQEGDYESDLYRKEYGPSFFKEHWRVIKKLLPGETLKDKTVMDVGAGDGSFLRYVNGYTKKIIAIEKNKDDIESYSHNFDVYNDIEECRQKADIITCFSVIEHVQNPKSLLINIHDRLKRGGFAVISTPNSEDFLMEHGRNYLEFFFRTSHKWYFTQKTLSALIFKCGFTEVNCVPYHRFGLINAIWWVVFGRPPTKKRCGAFRNLNIKWKEYQEGKGTADYLYMVAK